jgi:5,10-methylenetetrahydromethanopterin reductase
LRIVYTISTAVVEREGAWEANDVTVSMGVGLFPTEPPGRMRELTHLAERLGYDSVWFGDSQNIWREAYVTMGAAAVGTERIVFGTGVTNGVTRHPSVLASQWATLAELTAGRVALGIGTGDSSLRTMGLSPMKLAELEAYVEQLRALFRGEEAKEPQTGSPFRLNYLSEPIDVPIYIAASAPKILKLTGRIADGCVMLVGTDPNFIRGGLERLEAGAKEGGRSLEDLHIVLWTPTAIDEDGTRARDLVRAHVSRVVIRPLPAEIPEEDMAAVEKIRETYDYYHHMDTEASHADLVPDSLVDRFALAGTPEECRARVEQIADLGIDQISIIPFTPPGGDRGKTMEVFADLIPR